MATNYTLADIADAEAALAAGVMRITHAGVTTEFRSREDMIRQVRLMKRSLGIDEADVPVTPRIRRLRFQSTKGL